ncbi:MAG: hypothetical protein FWE16_02580 [Firmicutes bacterium]|nr:hypothetical protein [Bacillota bacterium]
MDIKLVRKLSELMNAEGMRKIEYADDFMAIRLIRATCEDECLDECDEPIEKMMPRKTGKKATVAGKTLKTAIASKTFEIRSPIEGKCWMSKVEGADTFVKVGEKVGVGDVLCMVETGNEFNEITTDVVGKIVEIAVNHGDELGFDQVMFKIQEA